MGIKSYGKCKQRALKDGKYCRYHQTLRTPKLPPDKRIELLDELIALREPTPKAAPSRHITQAEYDASPEEYFIVAKGTPRQNYAPRCTAKAKHAGRRCRNVACRGQRVCRFHGGKSTGPRTAEGKARCGRNFLVHGRETREKRRRVKQKHDELGVLAKMIVEFGG